MNYYLPSLCSSPPLCLIGTVHDLESNQQLSAERRPSRCLHRPRTAVRKEPLGGGGRLLINGPSPNVSPKNSLRSQKSSPACILHRVGMILFGDMDFFTSDSVKNKSGRRLWLGFLSLLVAGGHVYRDGLPAVCEIHKTRVDLSCADAFDEYVPDGGCRVVCGAQLPCGVRGHLCRRRCKEGGTQTGCYRRVHDGIRMTLVSGKQPFKVRRPVRSRLCPTKSFFRSHRQPSRLPSPMCEEVVVK